MYERFRQVRASAPAARTRAIAADIATDLPAAVGHEPAGRRGVGPRVRPASVLEFVDQFVAEARVVGGREGPQLLADGLVDVEVVE
ncbi:hypothetical protein BRC89_06940 [Halobacteriales archaeon QS_4_70_19]|nr:MAG: hypothetical protein BRC89_06940 [Halobacteriales archaeon QS_4_70_19]